MSEPAATIFAVVPAAGVGKRMASAVPKQYLELDGRCVLLHTLRRLAGHPRITRTAVAVAAHDTHFLTLAAELPPGCEAVTGGAERADSVLAGLRHLQRYARPHDWVLVHDAARPCVRPADIDRMLVTLADSDVGGILALPVRDTLKRADGNGRIAETIDRSTLWQAQTPQMFRYGLLSAALAAARASGEVVTDEAQAVERQGYSPLLVAGHSDNIKITEPEDLALAALILQAQAHVEQAG